MPSGKIFFKKGTSEPHFCAWVSGQRGGALPGSGDAAAGPEDPAWWPTTAFSLSWSSPLDPSAFPAGNGRAEGSWRGSRVALGPVKRKGRVSEGLQAKDGPIKPHSISVWFHSHTSLQPPFHPPTHSYPQSRLYPPPCPILTGISIAFDL
jgi:hypothetical protein